MKRILATGSIAAFAMLGFAGTANAAPSDSAAFGQLHKSVNSGPVGMALEVDNVGQFVQSLKNDPMSEFKNGGQAKKDFKS